MLAQPEQLIGSFQSRILSSWGVCELGWVDTTTHMVTWKDEVSELGNGLARLAVL